MISKTLQITCDLLNTFLKTEFRMEEDMVLLNNFVGQDGNIPIANKNKVIMSLIHTQKEDVRFNPLMNRDENVSRPKWDLDIIVIANFMKYAEGLNYLDTIIQYFDSNPVIELVEADREELGIQRILITESPLTLDQKHSLWNALGANLIPHMVYQLRIIG